MADQNPQSNYINDINVRIRDLEERQNMLKDRLLLIGQNLIDMREKNNEDILEIKKDIEMMKRNVDRLVSFLEMASSEFPKFARKQDLEVLQKQFRMFQPLEFIRNKDLKKSKS